MDPHADLYKELVDSLFDGVYFVDRDRKILLWNKGAERISGYSRGEITGSFCHNDILRHEDEAGRNICKNGCPLFLTLKDGLPREVQVFLHHKTGDRIPVLVKTAPMRDPSGEIVGAVEVFTDHSPQITLSRRVEELQKITHVDALTGVSNRRFVETSLAARIAEMDRYGWTFGVLFIDIDAFKQVNDLYGHSVGDGVLRIVADRIRAAARSFDTLGRWGGEEFVAIIVNVNDFELLTIAERLRLAVEGARIAQGETLLNLTVSIGATLLRPEDSPESVIARADGLMYKSKDRGGNRVTIG